MELLYYSAVCGVERSDVTNSIYSTELSNDTVQIKCKTSFSLHRSP